MKKSILQLGTPLTKHQLQKVKGGNVKLCDHFRDESLTVWVGPNGGYYVELTHSNGQKTQVQCDEQRAKSMCGW